MYIDVIYPNTIVDPKLLEDLCLQPPASEDGESGVTWDSFLFIDKPIPVSGWGDEDDPIPTNDAAYDATVEPQPLTLDENIEFGEASNIVNKEANCEKNVDSINVLYPVGKEINNEYANDEK